jgi:hypothetical protein
VAGPFQLLVTQNVHRRAERDGGVHGLESIGLKVEDSFANCGRKAFVIVHGLAARHARVVRHPKMREENRRKPVGLAQFDRVDKPLQPLLVLRRGCGQRCLRAHAGTQRLHRDTASIAFSPKASAPV